MILSSDFTYVCPTELISFSNRVEDFRALGAEVVGVRYIVFSFSFLFTIFLSHIQSHMEMTALDAFALTLLFLFLSAPTRTTPIWPG
jgi:hypothetical protein